MAPYSIFFSTFLFCRIGVSCTSKFSSEGSYFEFCCYCDDSMRSASSPMLSSFSKQFSSSFFSSKSILIGYENPNSSNSSDSGLSLIRGKFVLFWYCWLLLISWLLLLFLLLIMIPFNSPCRWRCSLDMISCSKNKKNNYHPKASHSRKIKIEVNLFQTPPPKDGNFLIPN